MDTDKLKVFLTVARSESIRKTAELLHQTPSTISKTIKQLEEHFQVELIAPWGRGITLTPAGKKLVHDAEEIVLRMDALKSSMHPETNKEVTRKLRIATFEVFSTYFLSTLQKVTDTQFRLLLHESLPGEIERLVDEGLVDYGLTYIPVSVPGVEHVKVRSLGMGVFKLKNNFKELPQKEIPFVVPVMPFHGNPCRMRGLDGWPDDAYERKVQYEVSLMESALELCRQGRCAGYFPRFIIEEHNRKYKSEFHLERHPSPYGARECTTDVFLVRKKGQQDERYFKMLTKMLRLV